MAGVETLRNLGPTSAELFAGVGITTAEQVRDLGAPLAYRLLRHRWGRRVSILFLYAIEGALQDRAFNSFSEAERAAMRASVEDEPRSSGASGRADS